MHDNVIFMVKDARMVREVKDATGIISLFLGSATKPFDYLYNSDYISATQKEDLRQQAIEMGLLPREARGKQQGQQTTAPPKGTY